MIDPAKTFTPEENLLISLCRLQFNETQKAQVSEYIRQVTDWTCFGRMANEHGIIALAAYNIKQTGQKKKIPGESMAILENGYMQNLARNTWLTERWEEVNTILEKNGIKHLLLKGMALEHTVYGAKGLRQMNDNDILVKREDAIKSWHLLQQEGFSHELIKSALHEKILADIDKHLPTLSRNGYSIDIHNQLSDSMVANNKHFNDPFNEAVEIFIGNTKAFIPSKVTHLMFLSAHFEKHATEGNCQLRMYTDIKLLDETSTIRVPDHFISNPKQENNPHYRKTAYKSNLRALSSKHRLRYITGDIFPSVKWMKKRYSCSGLKAMLYYPHRIFKLLWLI
jgi:hypothetical protein